MLKHYFLIYWNSIIHDINDDFNKDKFIPYKNRSKKFYERLKKNKLYFYEKEYVIFYEIDIDTVYGLTDKEHKSKYTIKYLLPIFLDIFDSIKIFPEVFKIYKNNRSYYLWYFFKKYSKRLKFGKNYWKNIEKYKLLTLFQKKRKLNIILKRGEKTYLNLTPGIGTKKLNMVNKKDKTLNKVRNWMIKKSFKYLYTKGFLYKCIIQFKGTTTNLHVYSEFLLTLNFKFKEVYFIFTPYIPYKFKYKKVRSLKKNFRKSFFVI